MATSGWHRKRKDTPAERARNAEYSSAAYRAAKKALRPVVEAGRASCWRCRRPIMPGGRWHLGHDDNDRSLLRGVECPPCNLSNAARKGARKRNSMRRRGTTRVRL